MSAGHGLPIMLKEVGRCVKVRPGRAWISRCDASDGSEQDFCNLPRVARGNLGWAVLSGEGADASGSTAARADRGAAAGSSASSSAGRAERFPAGPAGDPAAGTLPCAHGAGGARENDRAGRARATRQRRVQRVGKARRPRGAARERGDGAHAAADPGPPGAWVVNPSVPDDCAAEPASPGGVSSGTPGESSAHRGPPRVPAGDAPSTRSGRLEPERTVARFPDSHPPLGAGGERHVAPVAPGPDRQLGLRPDRGHGDHRQEHHPSG